jgi:hypothetical protein
MGDIDEKKLTVDFSQDRDLEAVKTKVLPFLKSVVAESGTVICVIREADEGGGAVQRVYHLGLGQAEVEVVETSAGAIAAYLAEYAKGKDGKLYSNATLEIHVAAKKPRFRSADNPVEVRCDLRLAFPGSGASANSPLSAG